MVEGAYAVNQHKANNTLKVTLSDHELDVVKPLIALANC